MKTLTVTVHAKPYRQMDVEFCFNVEVSDKYAHYLTKNVYELTPTEQEEYTEAMYQLKSVACGIAALQTSNTLIHTDIIDIR